VRYLGVDTGGTFTDLVEIDGEGRLRFDKAFSTPQAPEQGILDALARLAQTEGTDIRRVLGETVRFAHGTTVSTNALIQRRGARVGLITTRGFDDTLFIGRGPVGRVGGLPQSKAMDFLHTEPRPPLVPKARVRSVSERVVASGEVLAPLNEDEARAALEALLTAGTESLAVLAAITIARLSLAVPILPSGLGANEAILALLFAGMSLSPQTALAALLLGRVALVLTTALGAGLLLFGERGIKPRDVSSFAATP